MSNIGPAAGFPLSAPLDPCLSIVKVNVLDGKKGVGQILLVWTKRTEGAVTC